MVQIFSTFGLAIRSLRPGADLRRIIAASRIRGSAARRSVAVPRRAATGRRPGGDRGLWRAVSVHQPHHFGRARRRPARMPARWRWSASTRTRCLRWVGLGAALVGLAGAVMAIFFYIYPDVGASFALIAYVRGAWWFRSASCRGRHHRRSRRGHHRIDPAALSDGGRIIAVVASTRPTMMPPAKAPNTLPKPPSATVT